MTLKFEHSGGGSGQPYSLSSADLGQGSFLWNNWVLTYDFDRSKAVLGDIRLYENYNAQEFYGTYQLRIQGPCSSRPAGKAVLRIPVWPVWNGSGEPNLRSTSDYGGFLTANYQHKSAVYLQNIWKPNDK